MNRFTAIDIRKIAELNSKLIDYSYFDSRIYNSALNGNFNCSINFPDGLSTNSFIVEKILDHYRDLGFDIKFGPVHTGNGTLHISW